MIKTRRVINHEKKIRKYMLEWCPDIKQLFFNKPKTTIVLKDRRKATVKLQHGDRWSAEKGALYAYVKACKIHSPIRYSTNESECSKDFQAGPTFEIDPFEGSFKMCFIEDVYDLQEEFEKVHSGSISISKCTITNTNTNCQEKHGNI